MHQQTAIERLRDSARNGSTTVQMFRQLKQMLGEDAHVVDLVAHFRTAFCLTLSEAKPLAELSRTEDREITDAELLEETVMPAIQSHRAEWDRA